MTAGFNMGPKGAISSQSSFIVQLEENPELPYPEVKKMRKAI
jgi:hypothetical protein